MCNKDKLYADSPTQVHVVEDVIDADIPVNDDDDDNANDDVDDDGDGYCSGQIGRSGFLTGSLPCSWGR